MNERLTIRETEVALLLAGGLSNAEIARELGISFHTAKRHTEAVLRKIGARTRAGVAARLLQYAAAASGPRLT